MNLLKGLWYYIVRLDNEDNIYLLFYQMRKLAKYDRNGELLWERAIKNELLNEVPNRDKIRVGDKNTLHKSRSVFSLEITPKNNVIVGHVNGGCLFSPEGELKKIMADAYGLNLGEIKLVNDRLYNLLVFGHYIYVYHFKEE